MRSEFVVAGMTCEHCARAVEAEVRRLPGVHDVDVTLKTGAVIVTADRQLDRDAIRAAVVEAGYDLADV